MENQTTRTYDKSQASELATNKVLRNTYMLLSLTLLFSAGTAGLAMSMGVAPMNPFVMLIIYFALLFTTTKCSNSGWGILAIFAFTGFLGFTLGPILSFYMNNISNGGTLVMQALGGTGVIFVSLSAYTLVTRKDFSFMGGFLMVGLLVAFLASIASIFFHIPALSIAISAAFMLLSSGIILYQTSAIIHGGEKNYILATITLYVALYNIFLSLLRILSFFSGGRD